MIKKWMVASVVLFIIANTFVILGFTRGEVWGTNYVDPTKAASIIERVATIKSFTYVPVICGVSLLIVSLIIFAIAFHHLLKKESSKF